MEDSDSVGGPLRGGKEFPFSGVKRDPFSGVKRDPFSGVKRDLFSGVKRDPFSGVTSSDSLEEGDEQRCSECVGGLTISFLCKCKRNRPDIKNLRACGKEFQVANCVPGCAPAEV